MLRRNWEPPGLVCSRTTCARCGWALLREIWWTEIAARPRVCWRALNRLSTRPEVRLEACIRTAPAALAAFSSLLSRRSHPRVVSRARHLANEKVARNGHQRGKSHGWRHGQNTDGVMDRGAAGRGGEKHRYTDSRISRLVNGGCARRATERRSCAPTGTAFGKSKNGRERGSLQKWRGSRAARLRIFCPR